MLIVRNELPGDALAVREVLVDAFGRAAEADLVDALRARAAVTLALVAVEDERIVGHVLFTPVTVGDGEARAPAVALGPLGVLAARQRRGVGATLVRAGLAHCRARGHGAVFVLGHPSYYPRFGFVPARPLGITCPWPAPDEAFMVAELRPGALAGLHGTVRYAPEFDGV
jgi:putative acetyltransferase